MVRPQSRHVCQACGASFARWEGQCRACGGWNTLVETVVRPAERRGRPRSLADATANSEPVALRDLVPARPSRLTTGIGELDRVLGGGLVVGAVVLVAGEPGVGKSTLALETAAATATSAGGEVLVLYASGEESAAQLHLRAARLGISDGLAGDAIRIQATTEIRRIVDAALRLRPALLVVDSIQTMTVEELEGPAGSVGQVRESALRLLELAKGEGIAVLLVGHVTKDGSIAGPKALEHLVDVVLALEGEPGAAVRLLRASKNRFGSTDEVGVFELTQGGLRALADPSQLFLPAHAEPASGSVVAMILEGSRPLLVEVQALVSAGSYAVPRRTVAGLDADRLALLIAVLGKRAGVGIGSHDVYANLAGGLRSVEPALDLPLALALASSLRERPVAIGTVATGEVGLLGELRPIAGLERRLREAARLGYRRAVVPSGADTVTVEGLELAPVRTLREAIDVTIQIAPEDFAVRAAVAGGRGARR